MFTSNLEDLWFDIYSFLPIVLIQFLIMFVVLSVIFMVINRVSKKAYKIALVSAAIIAFVTYVQGNFLTYNLPGLDGNKIEWGAYGLDMVISLALWIITIVSAIVVIRKIKFEKFEKAIKYVSAGVLAMLVVTTVSLFAKPNVFDEKSTDVAMFDNFDTISSDKNFLIFLVDQVDSQVFNNELSNNWDKTEIFEDFTYYPDTTSTYMWTCYSIPYILSGEWHENKTAAFSDYFTSAIDNAPLLSKLESEKYKLNIYEDEELLNYKGNNLRRFQNIQSTNSINKKTLIKEEIKYVMFKYLPFPLKWMARIEGLDFNRTKIDESGRVFSSLNDIVYSHMKNNELTTTKDRYFSFTHVVGAHPPFVYNSNVERQPEGTYEDGINASIAMIKKYLERLKQSGAYDNSVIIVMSDHGHSNETIGRGNPILFIKGLNEKHEYTESTARISFENLNQAYEQLLNGEQTDKLFIGIDNSERRILVNELYDPNMKEFVQTGHAWDTSTIKETGRQFLRE